MTNETLKQALECVVNSTEFKIGNPAYEQCESQLRAALDAEQAKGREAEYGGVRCMCLLTGCRAGSGCPQYTEHCRKHIDWSNKTNAKARTLISGNPDFLSQALNEGDGVYKP